VNKKLKVFYFNDDFRYKILYIIPFGLLKTLYLKIDICNSLFHSEGFANPLLWNRYIFYQYKVCNYFISIFNTFILHSIFMLVKSHISNEEIPLQQAHKGEMIRKELFNMIVADFPDFTYDKYVSTKELNKYRKRYVENLIKEEYGEINKLEKEVLDAITYQKILSENINLEVKETLTLGNKLADKIATFGGSWSFIILFFCLLSFWMIVNAFLLHNQGYDPYPFILLNLILSCLAAIQAPIIMMSQNRQESKDRIRSESDYKINLKAEVEIRLLHEKVDHLLIHQNKRLLEIQELQTEYLQDILNKVK
jgi:uncharacterized membrane protein